MLQITKGFTNDLFIPIALINDNAGELERGAFPWDEADNVTISLISNTLTLGYTCTKDAKGVNFALSGDEPNGVYNVVMILDRAGGNNFVCIVDKLRITDKITPENNTLNAVYFYAQNNVLQFAQTYSGSDMPATIGQLNAMREQIARSGGGGGGTAMVSTTHAELKALRDAGQLVAGQKYRITDYTTTTTQEGTTAAGHDFDIIVTALDNKTLAEEAHAIQREGDTYFNNSNLAAWVLRYCIDMDGSRFNWAKGQAEQITFIFDSDVYIYARTPEYDDVEAGIFTWAKFDGGVLDPTDVVGTTTDKPKAGDTAYFEDGEEVPAPIAEYIPEQQAEGKGVIYYMEDEHGNIAPYDFKNILFVRPLNNGVYDTSGSDTNVYTFNGYDNGVIFDASTNDFADKICEKNTINECVDQNRMMLNDIVLLNNGESYDYSSKYNNFASGCNNITFADSCKYNTFAENNHDIVLGETCNNNNFGARCYEIVAGNSFSDNKINNGCYKITFGYACAYNTFGAKSNNIIIGNSANHNNFGSLCTQIKLGNGCNNINLADSNESIEILGTNSSYITIHQAAKGINFASNRVFKFVEILAGVSYVDIESTQATATEACQNILVNGGIKGTKAAHITLTVPTIDNKFLTTFGKADDTKINV